MGLRTNFDKPDVMKELSKQLINADGVLQVKKTKEDFETCGYYILSSNPFSA